MNTGDILIYQNPDGNIKIDVRLEDETVRLIGINGNPLWKSQEYHQRAYLKCFQGR